MKHIKVLPEGLIDRIAAGEVIENPASVVKELIENSLDASAANIDVSVKGGGKEEILIVDDGEGIPKDQVETAFMRHATSKIKSWEDLLRAFSMGFRGEALPSISSVSIMELNTCYEGEKVGSAIRFEGGKQVHFGPAPPKLGCSFSIRNLFYNVPARRKFLKSDSSEKRRISEIIRRYAIARHDVGFKLSHDGKNEASFPVSDNLLRRLEDIWGSKVSGDLLKIEVEEQGPVRVYGYISKPEMSRGNRSEIFFFVNSRPVLEKAMFGAVYASYSSRLDPGRYPYAAVFIDIEPTFVDINVHPAKTEVRFADERFVFVTLKKALDKTLSIPVGLNLKTSLPARTISFEDARRELFENLSQKEIAYPPVIREADEPSYAPRESRAYDPGTDISSSFQIFDTYIIIRRNGELIILDQHTAHERILFEKNLKSFDEQGSPSQKLLFEERVKLTPEESELTDQLSDLLNKAGFEIRRFGADEVIISGIPQELSRGEPGGVLKKLISNYSAYRREGQDIKRAVAAALACRGAVKAGQRLSDPEMKGLYLNLLACSEPYRCPHGRPTMAVMNRDDLEKIFKRK